MIDRDDLKAAVNAGVLSSQQAVRLEAFLVNRSRSGVETAGAGESENLRFLSNFNDIFITIGLVILFGGFAALFGYVVGTTIGATQSPALIGGVMALGIGGLAWVMMEYFCLRRRMLLPSMFLALVTSIAGGTLLLAIFSGPLGLSANIDSPLDALDSSTLAGMAYFAGAAATALLIFRRFGLPFSLFIVAVCAAGAVYIWLFRGAEVQSLTGGMAMFVTGLITLAVALFFDMKDPQRITRASDHAFWLHLAAAPQVIYGIGGLITGLVGSEASGAEAVTLLIVLIAIAILSLAINRRALIAASLITFIVTLSQIFYETGVDGLTTFITVSMIIGGGVVFIGAGWQTARKAVLKFFPTNGIWGRLFPPEIA